ncbi:tetratricopeptide repeat protein [Rhodothermus profundi]|nr:hypothetical protein [Rhodothermus profundi]
MSLALWPVPLLGMVHAASAALIALGAFFVAGGWAWRFFQQGGRLRDALRMQLLLLLIPWALLTLTVLWRPNCDYLRGMLFFLLFPPGSVVLAVTLANALESAGVQHGRRWFALIGLGTCVLPVAYDLLLHPQLYTYNHVFGGILGPLYDEDLALRPGLLSFRALTLLWAFWFGLVACFHRTPRLLQAGWWPALWSITALLGTFYLLAVPLGMNTSTTGLAQVLSGRITRGSVTLHYDPRRMTQEEAMLRAYRAAYDYERLARRLGIARPDPVRIFVFGDPVQRAQLTGARYTSVALVWLASPQIHLLQGRFEQSIAHELAHVLVRKWGLPLLGFSPRIGLVEGLAVALEPPDGQPTPHEQAAVAGLLARNRTDSLTAQVAQLLNPWGFWTSRSAVAYTLTGSFVRYLLDRFGAAPLRRVYGGTSFQSAYGQPVDSLVREWVRFLRRIPYVDRATLAVVRERFHVPSLFERRCPHYVPPHERAYEAAQRMLEQGDTLQAEALLDEALRRNSAFIPALVRWTQLRLLRGDAASVRERLAGADTLQDRRLQLHLADALALMGKVEAARVLYRRLYLQWPSYDLNGRGGIVLRYAAVGRPGALLHVLRWLENPRERCKSPFEDVSWDQTLPPGWARTLRQAMQWWTLGCGEASASEILAGGRALVESLRQVGAFSAAACVQETTLWLTWLRNVFPEYRSVCCAYCSW